MMKKLPISIILHCLVATTCLGQMRGFSYSQNIQNATEGWNKIELPGTVFRHVYSTGDIRIWSITNGDTSEAPFFAEQLLPEPASISFPFEILNKSSKNGVYFATFKLSKPQTINEINIDVANQNYDYKVSVQGSSNNQDWFTLLEDARIISLHTSAESYSFNKLQFSKSNYTYYRVAIPSATDPVFNGASITLNTDQVSQSTVYQSDAVYAKTAKDNRTEITVTLKEALPVSQIQLITQVAEDFVRTVTIDALTDSFTTEKGIKYSYTNVYSGLYSSLKANDYIFRTTVASTFKIKITNNDNAPVPIEKVVVSGYKNILTTRLPKADSYVMVYGNQEVNHPNYDVALFKDKLPKNINVALLGKLTSHHADTTQNVEKEHKWLLWLVMIVLIALLGGFTLKMMQNTENK